MNLRNYRRWNYYKTYKILFPSNEFRKQVKIIRFTCMAFFVTFFLILKLSPKCSGLKPETLYIFCHKFVRIFLSGLPEYLCHSCNAKGIHP